MVFKRPVQTTIITQDHNIDNLPDGVPGILQTLKELILQTPFNDLPDGVTPEPKVLRTHYRNSPETLDIKGYGDIILVLSFYSCELTFKLPNHKDNLILTKVLTKTLCNDSNLPFDGVKYHHGDSSDVFFNVTTNEASYHG